jgi:hypothetical protein
MPRPQQPPALEDLPDDIQGAIDDAPGNVAADGGEQQHADAFATLLLDDDAGAQRERQRHDQPEQDLAQAAARVQVTG